MVLSMERWKGKVAIVTGASAGIGAAIAERLVKEGLQVAGLARRKRRVEELSEKLQGESGTLHAVKADISKEEDILQAFKWIKDNLGPIHILVNNAGFLRNNGLTNGETQDWREIFDTTVLGLCMATREAVKDMRNNNVDGHIIHINSIDGHYVLHLPNLNVFPASKHAVTALTETLRQELNSIGSKIKISSISPGAVETEIAQASAIEMTPELEEIFKTVEMLKPEDVGDAVIFVLSTPPHVQVHELMVRPLGENY